MVPYHGDVVVVFFEQSRRMPVTPSLPDILDQTHSVMCN